ncbi:hypothetical protein ACA910_003464 [Epithemia clementina (nom. ined.)]
MSHCNNNNHHHHHHPRTFASLLQIIPRGGGSNLVVSSSSSSWWTSSLAFFLFLAGRHPFGYKLTALGEEFLSLEGSLDGDVGRFLASFRSSSSGSGNNSKPRKRLATLKAQWLEVVRVAKTRQAMRIYRTLDELIQFCVKAGFLE